MRLLWLADVLRAAGLTVHEVAGWQTRGDDAYGPVGGVIIHETRGSTTSTDSGEISVLLNGSNTAPPPIAQLYLSRSGEWSVVASGLCYHVLIGWGGPFAGLGNDSLLGIEAQHAAGEPWTPTQYDSYVRGVAAILRHTGWPPPVGHKEHQPGDKPDPAFDMNRFRADVARAKAAPLPQDQEEDTMLHGQIPEGEKTIIVGTPWDKSQISFGCDFGRARLRVAEHEVGKGWYITTVDLDSQDPARKDLPPRLNIDRRSIKRLPVDDTDTLDTPVGYLAWWK